MSWTLAKSAQTNKLLQRIENGDTKQLVKLLAGLPVYGGIQALREIAKYGEVQTDLETQTDKWYSEAVRLSGVSGTATELVLGRLTGPGSREPWYLFAPVFSILKDAGNIPKEVYKGNNDKALQIFSERIAPLPTWRRWIMKLFPDKDFITPVKQKDFKNRLKFNKGDIVNENNTDAVVVDQPFLEEAEAVASKKTLVPIKKPSVKEQVKELKRNETYDDKEFVKYMKIVENNELRLGNKNKLVHASAEGGNDTVAYGHKLTDNEKETGMIYGYKISELTKEQQDDILRRDLENAELELLNNYPEEYTSLDKRKKQMLIDFQFNGGSGMVDLFEKFRTGLFEGDENKIRKEYKRGYYKDKDKKNFINLDERNEEFAKFFFKKLKNNKEK